MKTKITTTVLGLFCLFQAAAQSTQVVDLSTGVLNNTTTLLAVNSYDDTWQVALPSSSTYSNVRCGSGSVIIGSTVYPSAWASNPNVRWLSPYTNGSGHATNSGFLGDYTYKMTFTSTGCPVSSAAITLTAFGGDNNVTSISVNGTPHALSATFNPLSSTTVTVAPGEIVSGTNTIIITVHNNLTNNPIPETTFTGLVVYGNLTINYSADPNLTPSISGNTAFCQGDPLTFTGSDGPSTATGHYWEIYECNSSGVPTTGGYNWYSWYSGAPGTFTFPVYLLCGKYYKVKLALANACTIWAESNKVVYINCPPTADAGPDQTICSGDCVNIGGYSSVGRNITYQWASPTGYPGTTAQVNVCPATTTTYTITVTDGNTGCTATDAVTVYVMTNDPSFSLSNNTSNPAYFTVSATPNDLSLPPGYGYAWFLEDLDPLNAAIFTFNNDPAWWTFPTTISNVFNGFDPITYTYSGTSTIATPSTPPQGHFLYNHDYRITRGTWNDYCEWQQVSQTFEVIKSASAGGLPMMIVSDDASAPDFSALATASIPALDLSGMLTVYPNPGKGVFMISSWKAINATIEVYDVLGNKVKSAETKTAFSNYELDLTGHAKGIYMLTITSGDQRYSKKIILE